MAIGDKKQPFTPSYEPIRDDVIGKTFSPGAIRKCPEPHVQSKFGVGGVANVSVYVCRKCRYVIQHKWMGGVSCGYEQSKLGGHSASDP